MYLFAVTCILVASVIVGSGARIEPRLIDCRDDSLVAQINKYVHKRVPPGVTGNTIALDQQTHP
jgi:hypothetical protein